MKRQLALLLFFFLVASGFKFGDSKLLQYPKSWPKPLYNFKENPLTKSKVELGRMLFYDPILSKDNTISCASCHSPFNAFTHVDHALSHGIGDSIGTRNSPSLMNLAWQSAFMWDGAIHHVDVQSLFPITHPKEMGESIEHVVQKLNASSLYTQQFKRAFGTEIVTGENTLKAIAQFMLTLVSCDSKYDSVIRKQATFTAQEENGYRLFQKNCSACHQEPLFTNHSFVNNGLKVDVKLQDNGRMGVSQRKEDSLCFKVPTLRNVEFSYPYMHDGRYKKMREVLNHYTDSIVVYANLSSELQKPIVLSSNEKTDLIAFLLTLTDMHFLFNTNYSYPKKLLPQTKD